MKSLVLVFVFALVLIESEGIEDWLSHELYPCIKCLCHARSGCWIRQNCARYSIDFNYWKTAGSVVANLDDLPNDKNSYESCMKDENCIVGTIIQFTEKFGRIDCNCDGKFDCKDRLAIHLLKGPNCEQPTFGRTYARRFNECASAVGVSTMLSKEGDDSCTAPEAV
ncbi:unnamed protein product [Psylliodes chrysocephalus]|uniref:lysozyme n=1 Tax=Psylliodes chrysocephalus TaxID=3402493 RepID=A0A9P0D1R6_9CUCU|nr:unnamed protein product [Psylliodes chrysocephala]